MQANLFGKFSVAVEQTLVIFLARHVGQVGSRSDDTWRPPTARSHLLVVPPPSLPRIGASQPQAPPATADADHQIITPVSCIAMLPSVQSLLPSKVEGMRRSRSCPDDGQAPGNGSSISKNSAAPSRVNNWGRRRGSVRWTPSAAACGLSKFVLLRDVRALFDLLRQSLV